MFVFDADGAGLASMLDVLEAGFETELDAGLIGVDAPARLMRSRAVVVGVGFGMGFGEGFGVGSGVGLRVTVCGVAVWLDWGSGSSGQSLVGVGSGWGAWFAVFGFGAGGFGAGGCVAAEPD